MVIQYRKATCTKHCSKLVGLTDSRDMARPHQITRICHRVYVVSSFSKDNVHIVICQEQNRSITALWFEEVIKNLLTHSLEILKFAFTIKCLPCINKLVLYFRGDIECYQEIFMEENKTSI